MRRGFLFLAWGLAGAGMSLFFSQIGAFTALPALLLAVALGWRGIGAEAFGLLAGVGSVAAAVGVVNLDYHPCPNHPVILPPGQHSFECGGFDGTPWLIVGIAITVASVLGFLLVSSARGWREPTR